MKVPSLCCASVDHSAVDYRSRKAPAQALVGMEAYEKLGFGSKVAIITGSSAGIGKQTALLMAARGAKLTLHGRRADKLSEVADEVEAISGQKPVTVIGNIEDGEVRSQLIQQTLEAFGRLDVLVNNAGWMKVADLDDTTIEDLRTMLEVHIVAPFDLIQLAAPELEKTTGNIVNVSSIVGQKGFSVMVAYSAAKAGLDNMTRSLSANLGPKGVRVNCVSPGQVPTDLLRIEDEMVLVTQKSELGIATPLTRATEATDVAELICFLASDAARAITGAIHTIDGGVSAIQF